MSEDLKGTVIFVGPSRSFFYIQHADERGQIEEFFGHTSECRWDAIGRKRTNIYLGCEVTFVAGDSNSRTKKRRALHIRADAPDLEGIDLASYRELGRVKELQRKERGGGYGLIERGADGLDVLPFRFYSVISEGIEDLAVGDYLEFSIGCIEKDEKISYFAADICLCFKEAEEIPTPEEVQPPKDSEKAYTSAERRLSLRELISRK